MNRLKQVADPASEARNLVALLDAAQPYQADPFEQRRVLRRVRARVDEGPKGRARGLWLVAVILCVAGAAGAFAGDLLQPASPAQPQGSEEGARHEPLKAGAPTQAPASARQAEVRSPQKQAAADADRSSESSEASDSSQTDQAAQPGSTRSETSQAGAARQQQTAALRSGEDPQQVVEAFDALRNKRNPKAAERLLQSYLDRNPKGALSEDALALMIEAAATQNDPKAAQYARQYLRRHPKGKHREVARRVLAAEN